MIGYIYKFTLTTTGKIYVGKRQSSIFDEKYFGSGLYWKRALKQHGGKAAVQREVLEWCETKEKLNLQEKYWIAKLNARDPNIGYNIATGGDGGWDFQDWSGENNGMYGVHRFGEANPNYGNHWDETSRKQMSNTIKARGGHHGKNNSMYGKHLSEETKEKIRASKFDEFGNSKYGGKNSVLYGKHETHPCFGLHWWSNGKDKPIKAKDCPGPDYHLGRK